MRKIVGVYSWKCVTGQHQQHRQTPQTCVHHGACTTVVACNVPGVHYNIIACMRRMHAHMYAPMNIFYIATRVAPNSMHARMLILLLCLSIGVILVDRTRARLAVLLADFLGHALATSEMLCFYAATRSKATQKHHLYSTPLASHHDCLSFC